MRSAGNCQIGAGLLRADLPGWRVADKTGNNGQDALGDIAVAWTASKRPVIMCAYTQGGEPKPELLRGALTGIGQRVGTQLA
jgi:beta-lactamase class A